MFTNKPSRKIMFVLLAFVVLLSMACAPLAALNNAADALLIEATPTATMAATVVSPANAEAPKADPAAQMTAQPTATLVPTSTTQAPANSNTNSNTNTNAIQVIVNVDATGKGSGEGNGTGTGEGNGTGAVNDTAEATAVATAQATAVATIQTSPASAPACSYWKTDAKSTQFLLPGHTARGDVEVDGMAYYDNGSGEGTSIVNLTSEPIKVYSEWGSGCEETTDVKYLVNKDLLVGCGDTTGDGIGDGCTSARIVTFQDGIEPSQKFYSELLK